MPIREQQQSRTFYARHEILLLSTPAASTILNIARKARSCVSRREQFDVKVLARKTRFEPAGFALLQLKLLGKPIRRLPVFILTQVENLQVIQAFYPLSMAIAKIHARAGGAVIIFRIRPIVNGAS
jgi:hypothetical protein